MLAGDLSISLPMDLSRIAVRAQTEDILKEDLFSHLGVDLPRAPFKGPLEDLPWDTAEDSFKDSSQDL